MLRSAILNSCARASGMISFVLSNTAMWTEAAAHCKALLTRFVQAKLEVRAHES